MTRMLHAGEKIWMFSFDWQDKISLHSLNDNITFISFSQRFIYINRCHHAITLLLYILQCKMEFNWGVGYVFGGLRNSFISTIHSLKIWVVHLLCSICSFTASLSLWSFVIRICSFSQVRISPIQLTNYFNTRTCQNWVDQVLKSLGTEASSQLGNSTMEAQVGVP